MPGDLHAWNDRLAACGCCDMPGCPKPTLQISGKHHDYFWLFRPISDLTGTHNAWIDLATTTDDIICGRWLKSTQTFAWSRSDPAPTGSDDQPYYRRDYSGTATWAREVDNPDPLTGGEVATPPLSYTSTGTVTLRIRKYYKDANDDWYVDEEKVRTATPDGAGAWDLETVTTSYDTDGEIIGTPVTATSGPMVPSFGHDYLGVSGWRVMGTGGSYTTGGVTTAGFDADWDHSDGESVGTQTISMSRPFNAEELDDIIDTWFTGRPAGHADFDDPWPLDADTVQLLDHDHNTDTCTSLSKDSEAARSHYRWRIHSDHHPGTHFEIEWDEIFFPEGWDAPGGTAPTVTPKSWVWTGPGDPDDPADATWFSPWSLRVDGQAETPGQTEIRNVRYLCQQGPYGSLPEPHEDFQTYTPPE